jgi:RNA polymerase sigma-70 factor (ECF subfamily)
MARYQAGEVEAFEELYRRTRGLVQRYHRAFAADGAQALDLTQETYLQLHRSRRLYDPRLPVRPWLLAIARHVRLMAARTLRRRLSREVALGERDAEHAAELGSLLDTAILTQALERLPEKYREPLVLHHLFGLSFRDIAGMVGASEGGARVRASRGMTALRQILAARSSRPADQTSHGCRHESTKIRKHETDG